MALEMNGGDDSIVRIPSSVSLQQTADKITVMAWAYLNDWNHVALFGHGYPFVFLGFHNEKNTLGNPTIRAFKWQVATKPDEDCLPSEAPCRLTIFVDDNTMALGVWYHLAGTFDGQDAKLFVNGQQVGYVSSFSKPTTIPTPTTDFSISGYLDNGRIVDEISGRIDDVRVFDRVLNDHEIRAIYDETR